MDCDDEGRNGSLEGTFDLIVSCFSGEQWKSEWLWTSNSYASSLCLPYSAFNLEETCHHRLII